MRALAERNWKAAGGGVKNLHARHEEHGVDACLQVVANMADQWIGDKYMEFYFRPSTLFRPSHFDEYLNARRKTPPPVGGGHVKRMFRISCLRCRRWWQRVAVVPAATRFVRQEWNRKTSEEAFSGSTEGNGVECSCDDHVTVEPVVPEGDDAD